MLDTFWDFVFILNRYLHIVCAMVIVGGTLFFELIVPAATDELKEEQQLHVFGKARWGFRTLVWSCAVLLIFTGIVSTVRHWRDYSGPARASSVPVDAPEPVRAAMSDIRRPGWWWAAHVSAGVIALVVAASLMTVRRPPQYPLYWMRLSLTILLIVIFFATTARHMRLSLYDVAAHHPRAPE